MGIRQHIQRTIWGAFTIELEVTAWREQAEPVTMVIQAQWHLGACYMAGKRSHQLATRNTNNPLLFCCNIGVFECTALWNQQQCKWQILFTLGRKGGYDGSRCWHFFQKLAQPTNGREEGSSKPPKGEYDYSLEMWTTESEVTLAIRSDNLKEQMWHLSIFNSLAQVYFDWCFLHTTHSPPKNSAYVVNSEVSMGQASLPACPEFPQLHFAAEIPQGCFSNIIAISMGCPGFHYQVLGTHLQDKLGKVPGTGNKVPDEHASLFLSGRREKKDNLVRIRKYKNQA